MIKIFDVYEDTFTTKKHFKLTYQMLVEITDNSVAEVSVSRSLGSYRSETIKHPNEKGFIKLQKTVFSRLRAHTANNLKKDHPQIYAHLI